MFGSWMHARLFHAEQGKWRHIWLPRRAVNALANDPEFYLEKLLEPGEMEWLANHSIFHSRAPIQDVRFCTVVRQLVS